jgi:hypothetical protein
MSAKASGSAGKSKGSDAKPGEPVVMPTAPAALEREIQDRRDHLAATIDELTARTKPKEIARRSAVGALAKARSVTHGPDGRLRTERLAAVAGAAAVVVGVMVLLRRRR